MKTVILIFMKVVEGLGAIAALIWIPMWTGKFAHYLGLWKVAYRYDKDFMDFWLTGILSILIVAVACILIGVAGYLFPIWIKWNQKLRDKIIGKSAKIKPGPYYVDELPLCAQCEANISPGLSPECDKCIHCSRREFIIEKHLDD